MASDALGSDVEADLKTDLDSDLDSDLEAGLEAALAAAVKEAADASARAEAARARAERLREKANPAAARRGQRRWLPALGVAALVAIICASFGASGALFWHHHLASRHDQRVAEAAAAARECVDALMSMDSRTAERNAQRVIELSTGSFKDTYQAVSTSVTKDLVDSKIATAVRVNDVAVESADGDKAAVLVAVQTVRTNTDGTQQDPWRWRIRVSLVRDGGQLKMSEVGVIQ